jgi:hypothetical protein
MALRQQESSVHGPQTASIKVIKYPPFFQNAPLPLLSVEK